MALTPVQFLWETRFPSLRDSMDKLFEDFFGNAAFPSLRTEHWLPAVDVHDTKKELVVTMDIPSVDPAELSIAITDNMLTIKGVKKKEDELEEQDAYRQERYYGTFQRTVQLPAEVMADKAKATYKDGVLKIRIPKSQKIMPKEIRVEVK